MDKWITKNQALIFRVSAIIFIFTGIAIARFTSVDSLTACAIYVMLVVLMFTLLTVITTKTTQRLMSIFEDTCDPTEIFDFFEHLYIKYSKNVVYQINHSFVLSLSGRKNEQKAFLEGIDINKHQKNSLICFIYYNNLFNAYYSLNEQDKMEQAYENAIKYYNAIKSEKTKKCYEKSINELNLDYAILRCNVEDAISYIEKKPQNKLLDKVDYSLSMAKILIMQNEAEKAKEYLSFVIQNANKISLGQEAKEILVKIS